jgi:hypothetical protein
MSKDEGAKDMPSLKERLAEANKKVESRLDEIWAKAEGNLKKLEDEYKRCNKGE